MLRFRKKSVQETKIEKKSCRDCAYLQYGFFGFGGRGRHDMNERWNCKADGSSVDKNELDSRCCNKFMRKKKGMTLEQQIEEEKQQRIIEEQERSAKEQKRLLNRLRRNWYYVSALAISLIALAIAIWKLLHP
jgi:xanthine dehydrogenase molybdopterin-binding subunit B